MAITSDRKIAQILVSCRRIALLGASADRARPSYRVMQFLLTRGYDVYPVNPKLSTQTILGRAVYASLQDVPVRVDMVDVFRNAGFLHSVVDEVILARVGVLWTQLGVVDEASTAMAEEAGLKVVVNRCPAIEWPRLQSAGYILCQ